jgi:hypothetical protein
LRVEHWKRPPKMKRNVFLAHPVVRVNTEARHGLSACLEDRRLRRPVCRLMKVGLPCRGAAAAVDSVPDPSRCKTRHEARAMEPG